MSEVDKKVLMGGLLTTLLSALMGHMQSRRFLERVEESFSVWGELYVTKETGQRCTLLDWL